MALRDLSDSTGVQVEEEVFTRFLESIRAEDESFDAINFSAYMHTGLFASLPEAEFVRKIDLLRCFFHENDYFGICKVEDPNYRIAVYGYEK